MKLKKYISQLASIRTDSFIVKNSLVSTQERCISALTMEMTTQIYRYLDESEAQ